MDKHEYLKKNQRATVSFSISVEFFFFAKNIPCNCQAFASTRYIKTLMLLGHAFILNVLTGQKKNILCLAVHQNDG